MKILLFFLITFSSFLAATEKISNDAGTLNIEDNRENYFLTSSYKIAAKVNPISGEYQEEETDISVAGSQPLSLRRYHNHFAPFDPRYGCWRFNPEHQIVANLEWSRQQSYVSIGEENGNVTCLERKEGNKFLFSLGNQKGFSQFTPEGKSHPFNYEFIYYKDFDPKNKDRFSWYGEIINGSGSKRSFTSPRHGWLENAEVTKKRGGIAPSETTRSYTPNVWTPFQLQVAEERLPNGNFLCYEYFKRIDDKHYPKPMLLKTITAYNGTKSKKLGSLHFAYPKIEDGVVKEIVVQGSDDRRVYFSLLGRQSGIVTTLSPENPTVTYAYKGFSLNYVEKPDGRILKTEFDRTGRVSAQYAPIGPNGEMFPINFYTYRDRSTEVIDAEGHKTVYQFNEHKQIEAIETYQNGRIFHVNRFKWDPKTGDLLRKSLEDASGKAFLITEYEYDKNHNPILERTGDGKTWYIVNRTFSNDGFNLKTSESDREGKKVVYSYVPNTNLLASELVYNQNKICKRTFHTYDDCAICVKTTVDDGSSADPQNLQHVTFRKIVEIQPKQTFPCFGLPEIVQEKTINHVGQEILLHKVIYAYTPFGKVLKEEHYDAENKYCYTIQNQYDHELLIATTDPLGNKIAFTYDANHNLLSSVGPKNNQRKEIQYDKANRPIQIKEWQSESDILVTKKRYDKLGQLIAEVDPCGNETRFEYDALGKVIAIHHPDGAIERKEYDILGNVIKETDALGHITFKTYDFRGKPIYIYYPDGGEEHFTYHANGTVASHTDKNGSKTVFSYDIFDNPIRQETSGKVIAAHFTPFFKTSETDSLGITTEYTYDFAGRKIKERKANKETHYSYDSLGRLVKTDHEYFHVIEGYDLANRVIEKRIEDLSGQMQFLEKYAYDKAGNRTKVITSKGFYETFYNGLGQPILEKDPHGNTTTHTYQFQKEYVETTTDALGIQTVRIFDSRGHEKENLKKNRSGEVIAKTRNKYDSLGNLVDQTHFVFQGAELLKKIEHHWDYGPMRRLERFIEAGERETRYLYNQRGQLEVTVKPSGTKLCKEYDGFGRLNRYFSSDFDYRYAYDANDRLISVYDEVSKKRTIRTYDALDNVLEEQLANGLKLKNVFDSQARRKSLILPDSSTIDYLYQGKYLLSAGRHNKNFVYAKRDMDGCLVEANFPENLGRLLIKRDAMSRWQKFETPFYQAHFPENAYDAVGNLCHYRYEDAMGKVSCDYAYDDLEQLISENEHKFLFDSLHNCLQKDEHKYEVNNLCQTEEDGVKTYQYDKDGNLFTDLQWNFIYDTQDRLIAVEKDKIRIEYAYDPFHRRISKQIFQNKKLKEQIHYIWDGEREIGSTDTKGTIQELRILGEGLGAEIGAAVIYELKGKIYIPIQDHRGCVVTLIDPKTKKKECYRYSAFGEELTNNKLSPWRFSSKRVDDETGLIYFGRRYYNPTLGKWTTQDPNGFEDGANLYAYLHNCPMNDFDPYGLWSWNGMWSGTRDYFYNAGSYAWDGLRGVGYGIGKMGEWMHAEHFYHRSSLEDKSYQVRENWKNLGKAARNDPLGMLAPGIMEAWRNPTSPGAWGKASVDIALLGLTALKATSSIANIGRAGRVGEELGIIAKIDNIKNASFSSRSVKNSFSWERIVNPFRGKSFEEIDKMLINKGFYTKGPNPFIGKGAYFHPTTNRKYYLDHGGRTYRHGIKELPHVDVHYRYPCNTVQKRRFPLGDDLYE